MMLDDDVIVGLHWLRDMLRKFDDPNVMGVAGGICLCPSLSRPWMTPLHKSWLACTVEVDPAFPKRMVGANMAIRRSVLEKIPGFDTELGPGRLGFADDSLFSAQMLFANMRIVSCFEAAVIHRPDISRLDRSSWLHAARKRGESEAYVGYHWQHWGNRQPFLKKLVADLRLLRWRMCNRRLMTSPEGCSDAELKLVWGQALVAALVKESAKRRKYVYRGLIKIR
jgi:GT2 family glycosyltransferase